jgi:hypothetical protein
LPIDFRHSFRDHQAHTAEWAGLKGKKNGELLREAEVAGYEVLLTIRRDLETRRRQVEIGGTKIR